MKFFSLSNNGELRQDETCATVFKIGIENKSLKILMKRCVGSENENEWMLEVCK